MAHFAELDENNVVINVIVVNNSDCLDENGNESEEVAVDFLLKTHGENRIWKQTSYNSNMRRRYAFIGGTYNSDLDIFLNPKPFPSWILNETIGDWDPPVPYPDLTEEEINTMRENNQYYDWNEDIVNWQIYTFEQ